MSERGTAARSPGAAASSWLLVVLLGVLTVAVPAASSSPEAEPRLITWEEAVALGHPAVRDFERPDGMPVCPPVKRDVSGIPDGESVPDDAPVCWTPPEQQGLRFEWPLRQERDMPFSLPGG